MTEEVKKLNSKQFDLIKNEFGLDREEVLSLDMSDLEDLYDKICDIEVEEAEKNVYPLNERGEIAADIVTILGDYYRKQVEDFEDDDEEE